MTETAESWTETRWYVAQTRPGAETKALFHLERQGFEVYLPRYLRRVSHARRISWQPRPLFPSYLFVTTSPAQQRWRSINSTVGIAHLICDDRGPVPVPPGIVEGIRRAEDDRGPQGAVREGRRGSDHDGAVRRPYRPFRMRHRRGTGRDPARPSGPAGASQS